MQSTQQIAASQAWQPAQILYKNVLWNGFFKAAFCHLSEKAARKYVYEIDAWWQKSATD